MGLRRTHTPPRSVRPRQRHRLAGRHILSEEVDASELCILLRHQHVAKQRSLPFHPPLGRNRGIPDGGHGFNDDEQ